MTARTERALYPFSGAEIERDVEPALRELQARVAESIKIHDQVIAALKAGQQVPMFASGPQAVFGAEGLRSDFVLRHKRLTELIHRGLNAVYGGEDEDGGPNLCAVQVRAWNTTRERMELCGMELPCPTHNHEPEAAPAAD